VQKGQTPADSPDEGLTRLVAQAVDDLAQRLLVPSHEIDVLEARAVVWPDPSCGCPRPGMRYTQVQVEGALIRLAAGGRTFEYHSGAGDRPFLCAHQPTTAAEPRTPFDLTPRITETEEDDDLPQ